MEEIATNPNIKFGKSPKMFISVATLKAVGFVFILFGNFLAIEPLMKKYSFKENVTNLGLIFIVPLINSIFAFLFYLNMIASMMTYVEERILMASKTSTVSGIKYAVNLFEKFQTTFNLPNFFVLSTR